MTASASGTVMTCEFSCGAQNRKQRARERERERERERHTHTQRERLVRVPVCVVS